MTETIKAISALVASAGIATGATFYGYGKFTESKARARFYDNLGGTVTDSMSTFTKVFAGSVEEGAKAELAQRAEQVATV